MPRLVQDGLDTVAPTMSKRVVQISKEVLAKFLNHKERFIGFDECPAELRALADEAEGSSIVTCTVKEVSAPTPAVRLRGRQKQGQHVCRQGGDPDVQKAPAPAHLC